MHKLLLDIPMRLDTERLIIRKYAEGDGRELYLLLERNDDREFLRENMEGYHPLKLRKKLRSRLGSIQLNGLPVTDLLWAFG